MANDITYIRPEVVDAAPRRAMVRDVCKGQYAVQPKDKGYLLEVNPLDKSAQNETRNKQYRERAVFYGATGNTRDGLVGMAFAKDPTEVIPPKLEYLQSDANSSGVSIYQMSQQSLSALLETGGDGLYVDYHRDEAGSVKNDRVAFVSYQVENILNWAHDRIGGKIKLTLVVLKEYREGRDGYAIVQQERRRELALVDGVFVCSVWERPDEKSDFAIVEQYTPVDAKGKPFDEIPFVFMGSRTNDFALDDAPLYPLAVLNLAHYRNSADYEDSVFICGQPQPWLSGLTEEWRDWMQTEGKLYTGSRSAVLLPVNGAYGYAQALPNTMVKEAMEQKEAQMIALGARIVEHNGAVKTATQSKGEQSASTSVLAMCVSNVSEGFTQALQWAVRYTEIAEQEVNYSINQDFVEIVAEPQMIVALVGAWQSGAFAKADLLRYLRRLTVIDSERTDADIEDDLAMEGPALGSMAAPVANPAANPAAA